MRVYLILIISILIESCSSGDAGGNGSSQTIITIDTPEIQTFQQGDTYTATLTLGDTTNGNSSSGEITATVGGVVQNPYGIDCRSVVYTGTLTGSSGTIAYSKTILIYQDTGNSQYQCGEFNDSLGRYVFLTDTATSPNGLFMQVQSPIQVGDSTSGTVYFDDGTWEDCARTVVAKENVTALTGIYEAFKVTVSCNYSDGTSLAENSWIIPGTLFPVKASSVADTLSSESTMISYTPYALVNNDYPQTRQPLLQLSDITYIGSFQLPRPAYGADPQSFDYGGMGLAVTEDGKNLYVGGHVYNESLGLVEIPDPIGGTATLLKAPVEVPGSIGTEGSAPELSGALVYNNRLIVQKRIYYDNSGNRPTHAVGNLDISGFTPFTRLANTPFAQYGSGYMGVIPSEWQELLGGPAFAGNSSMSIISKCSNGPSFYAFNPDDVGVISPIPSIPLMYFTYDNPIVADRDAANDIWIRADQSNAGIVFPSGTRSVLFWSRHGYGDRTYKQDDGCGGSAGEGAAPYRRQITAFDANDLFAVKNGEKQPWEIRPYAWWEVPGPKDTCSQFRAAGLAYDPLSRRVYAAFDYKSNPEIHVWQISGSNAVQ